MSLVPFLTILDTIQEYLGIQITYGDGMIYRWLEDSGVSVWINSLQVWLASLVDIIGISDSSIA
ncbi:MAG: hypothetical protein F4010_05640, partial [Cenarchaeum sp. SB0669_bin_11]|nr:hypothetical protein [Cenarchaeum sp. SB0669_bin_11]